MEEIMATAIKGAVIADEHFYYRKCEVCGYTSSFTYQANLRFFGDTYRHSFKCQKCGNKQDIEIKDS